MISLAIMLAAENKSGFSYTTVVLIFLALLLGLYLYSMTRKEKRDRQDELLETYREMTPEKLASVPESELVRAIIANLMAKLDARHPDPYRDIPLLSPGRCAVYSVWAAGNELSGGNFEGFFASPAACFAELAADGYDRIGAPRCGDILREAMAAAPSALAELNAAFSDAAEAEQPMVLCAEYIRDNPEEFVDTPEEDTVLPRETDELL